MATTTNYGWVTPDDTSLVKDGASAIRTLGTSIDTTTFNNASAAIAKTIVDAKGDIIAATAADTVARLAVGTNGQVLTADSTAATGLAYTTISAGGMTLISTTTLSGASITLSSIPQTYNSLYVVIRNWRNANDGEAFYMRFNADATASRHRGIYTAGQAGNTFNGSFIQMSTLTDNGASQGSAAITFPDYTNTTTWKTANIFTVGNDSSVTTEVRSAWMQAIYNQTGAITSLQFLASAGNLTSGDVLLYGVK